MKRVRVAHLVSHPIQYFAPLYRELAKRPEIELTVYFASDAGSKPYHDPQFGREVGWDVPTLGGYEHRMLPSAVGRDLDSVRTRPNVDVLRDIDTGTYDAVWCHGYTLPNTWGAFLSARRRKRLFVLRDEAIGAHARTRTRRVLKQPPLRVLTHRAVIAYLGEANRRYFENFGVPAERMYRAPYSVDNAFFRSKAAELSSRKAELRHEFGLPRDRPVFLYSGKFIDKKRPLQTVRAFATARRGLKMALLMAGDGPLAESARQMVADERIPDVVFAGFLNQTEVPRAYAAADSLVLFSGDGETWGLVVNEAMNFGLAVIASTKVGSAPDLVEPFVNGLVVPYDDVPALADALRTAATDPERLTTWGDAGLKRIDEYDIGATADGMVAACTHRTAG